MGKAEIDTTSRFFAKKTGLKTYEYQLPGEIVILILTGPPSPWGHANTIAFPIPVVWS
jgi:hypothetical protein